MINAKMDISVVTINVHQLFEFHTVNRNSYSNDQIIPLCGFLTRSCRCILQMYNMVTDPSHNPHQSISTNRSQQPDRNKWTGNIYILSPINTTASSSRKKNCPKVTMFYAFIYVAESPFCGRTVRQGCSSSCDLSRRTSLFSADNNGRGVHLGKQR